MKLHSLFTVLDITDIHLLHIAKHLRVDLRTFLCCLSEEIPQAVVEQLKQERWQERHAAVYSLPGCVFGDVWNDTVSRRQWLQGCTCAWCNTASEIMKWWGKLMMMQWYDSLSCLVLIIHCWDLRETKRIQSYGIMYVNWSWWGFPSGETHCLCEYTQLCIHTVTL